MDPEGRERYRFVGWMPAAEFEAQLMMGLAKTAFSHKQWPEAGRWFGQIVEQFSEAEVAPEALYWIGVCRYKAANDHHALAETARQLTQQYPQSNWARRGSVWLPKAVS